MRICLISREYPPETGFGGIATFTKHLAHGLTLLGCEVTVIALTQGFPSIKEDAVFDDSRQFQGVVEVHRVNPAPFASELTNLSKAMPYTRYVANSSAALWLKFLELHTAKNFDVIDSPELLAEGFFPALCQNIPHVVRLYTPHSKFVSEKLHNLNASFDNQLVSLLERITMVNADILTAPSNDLAQYVADDLGISIDEIDIVRNPVDTSIFTPDGPKKQRSHQDSLEVLFVGRLEVRKGITYLVEAIPEILKIVPGVKFVIIGNDTNTGAGETSILQSLKDQLAKDKTSHCVEFIERVDLEELPFHYRSADLVVVPSLYDNSPYSCLEAMACGTPVVGTSAGGTKEYIEHEHTGLIVEPKNGLVLAEAISKLLSDPQQRTRFGDNARRQALSNFDRLEIARKTVAIYEKAISKHGNQTNKRRRGLYNRNPDELFLGAQNLILSMDSVFDDVVHKIRYEASLRYRMRCLMNEFSRRPKLTLAKLLSKSYKAATKSMSSNRLVSTPLAKLEAEISAKEKQAKG